MKNIFVIAAAVLASVSLVFADETPPAPETTTSEMSAPEASPPVAKKARKAKKDKKAKKAKKAKKDKKAKKAKKKAAKKAKKEHRGEAPAAVPTEAVQPADAAPPASN